MAQHLDLAAAACSHWSCPRGGGGPCPRPSRRTRCGCARRRRTSAARSGSKTTCAMPSRSRRSMKITPPWSRRRCTQPNSVTTWSSRSADDLAGVAGAHAQSSPLFGGLVGRTGALQGAGGAGVRGGAGCGGAGGAAPGVSGGVRRRAAGATTPMDTMYFSASSTLMSSSIDSSRAASGKSPTWGSAWSARRPDTHVDVASARCAASPRSLGRRRAGHGTRSSRLPARGYCTSSALRNALPCGESSVSLTCFTLE